MVEDINEGKADGLLLEFKLGHTDGLMLGLEDGFSDSRIVGTKEGLVLGKSHGLNEGDSHDGKYKTVSNCLFSSSNCNISILISLVMY